jgi:5'-nucleotidase (lipoprotein e(P4) family)
MPLRSAIRSLAAIGFVLAAGSGCRSTSAIAPAAPVAAPPPVTAPAVPDSIKWVRTSAEYVALVEQVYRLATAHVESEARSREPGRWAVVLDADETVIDNSLYQEERAKAGLGYSEESWDAWVKRREAVPLPGAAPFLAHVRQLGGRIAIVTNRLQTQCDDTTAVFVKYALVFDAMLCRQNGTPSDKNPRFEAVAAGRTPAGSGPLDVVAFIGDNILDFPRLSQAVRGQGTTAFTQFGVRFFLLPNPMYGSWQ